MKLSPAALQEQDCQTESDTRVTAAVAAAVTSCRGVRVVGKFGVKETGFERKVWSVHHNYVIDTFSSLNTKEPEFFKIRSRCTHRNIKINF